MSTSHSPETGWNPFQLSAELRRQCWLEFSPTRLVLMPAVLLLCFATIAAMSDMDALPLSAIIGFVLITVLWGGSLAAASVSDEIARHTWDWQRMSSITPLEITLGKLLGGPAYAWYGGGICLLVFVLSSLHNSPHNITQDIAFWGIVLPGIALTLHATAMILAIWGIGKFGAQGPGRLRSMVVSLATLCLFGGLSAITHRLSSEEDTTVAWYALSLPLRSFCLLSVFLFAAWALAGVYRSFRAQLQYRNHPWVWTAFVLFLMVYLAGFLQMPGNWLAGHSGSLLNPLGNTRLMLAASVAAGLCLICLLHEKHDPVAFRALWADWQVYRTPLHLIPLWSIALGFATLIAAALVLLNGLDRTGGLVLACWAFMVRDVAVILALQLRQTGKPADGLVMVYLAVAYSILPVFTYEFGLFLPNLKQEPLLMPLSPLIQAAIACLLLGRVFKTRFIVK